MLKQLINNNVHKPQSTGHNRLKPNHQLAMDVELRSQAVINKRAHLPASCVYIVQ